MTSRLLFLFGALLLLGAAEAPTPPVLLPPAEAAKQGRALVAEILSQLSQRPAQNVTNNGDLRICDAKGKRTEVPVRFEIAAGETNWWSLYEAAAATNGTGTVRLRIVHAEGQPNEYRLNREWRAAGADRK